MRSNLLNKTINKPKTLFTHLTLRTQHYTTPLHTTRHYTEVQLKITASQFQFGMALICKTEVGKSRKCIWKRWNYEQQRTATVMEVQCNAIGAAYKTALVRGQI